MKLGCLLQAFCLGFALLNIVDTLIRGEWGSHLDDPEMEKKEAGPIAASTPLFHGSQGAHLKGFPRSTRPQQRKCVLWYPLLMTPGSMPFKTPVGLPSDGRFREEKEVGM